MQLFKQHFGRNFFNFNIQPASCNEQLYSSSEGCTDDKFVKGCAGRYNNPPAPLPIQKNRAAVDCRTVLKCQEMLRLLESKEFCVGIECLGVGDLAAIGLEERRCQCPTVRRVQIRSRIQRETAFRSEEHTSELQSLRHLVCRLLL